MNKRNLKGIESIIVKLISIFLALFLIWVIVIGSGKAYLVRGVFIGGCIVLTFLYFGATKRSSLKHFSRFDIILCTFAIVNTAFYVYEYPRAILRVGLTPGSLEIIFSITMILLVMEASRRVIGPPLMIISVVFFVYAWLGNYFPGYFQHPGSTFTRIAMDTSMSLHGIYGNITSIIAMVVFPFILFSTFFMKVGGIKFFLGLAIRLVGKTVGGPAKVAVIASSLMAMISGTNVGNVVATGSFTIPTMIRSGVPAYVAAAVEAVSSLGGGITPPVMGAVAFIMSDLAGIPYKTIAVAAILPAFLYYALLFFVLHAKACKQNIKPDYEMLKNLIKIKYTDIFYFVPISVLILMLARGFSPRYTAIVGTCIILLILIVKLKFNFFKGFIESLEQSIVTTLSIGGIVGSIGIIIFCANFSGLPMKFSGLISDVPNLLVLTFLLLIICFVMGIGVTPSTSYVVTAITVVPALIKFGIDPIQAHFATFWFSLTGTITPPVALAAFAAASLADAPLMKTGIHACKLGFGLYIIPFLFIFTPILRIYELPLFDMTILLFGSVSALIAIGGVIENWFWAKLSITERLLLLVGAYLAVFPEVVLLRIIGIIFPIFLYLYKKNIITKKVLGDTSSEIGI